ncbi:hypothetical protein ACG74X_11190 [Marivita sp. S0852]|uniref:hypothetical protein n=1 Tax=Marivita sp. S0852 TaxID=3373893 RepID=UPI0039824609
MLRSFKITLASILLSTSMAGASDSGDPQALETSVLENGVMSYQIFEASIKHVDLETCPADVDGDSTFCRMTLASDLAHVFVFSDDGEQPLLSVRSYELGDGFLPF